MNWPADQLLALSRAARREDVPQPICAQLAYSLVHRSPVEDDDMRTALEACGAPVVASYVLAGGVLSGKYDVDPRRAGPRARSTSRCTPPPRRPPVRSAQLAERLETTPAALAVAFALQNPAVATVLFGATKPAQIEQNVAALELEARLTAADRAELIAIGT